MQTTVNVVCYKSKTLSNGEHPLMLRLCQGQKLKYISLKISINPQYWDFEKNKPKRSCPNKDEIQTLINKKIKDYSDKIIEYKSIEKEFTITTLIENVGSNVKPKTVGALFNIHIDRLMKAKRRGYALHFQQVYNSLIEYNGNLDIYFSEIDVLWLRRYEDYLKRKALSDNTIGIRFRTLRALYNVAIEEKIVKAEYYPFKKYKVSKLHQETAKRSVLRTDIERILNYQTGHEYTRFSIDIFLFSYLCGGINFTDIAYLTKDNLIEVI